MIEAEVCSITEFVLKLPDINHHITNEVNYQMAILKLTVALLKKYVASNTEEEIFVDLNCSFKI